MSNQCDAFLSSWSNTSIVEVRFGKYTSWTFLLTFTSVQFSSMHSDEVSTKTCLLVLILLLEPCLTFWTWIYHQYTHQHDFHEDKELLVRMLYHWATKLPTSCNWHKIVLRVSSSLRYYFPERVYTHVLNFMPSHNKDVNKATQDVHYFEDLPSRVTCSTLPRSSFNFFLFLGRSRLSVHQKESSSSVRTQPPPNLLALVVQSRTWCTRWIWIGP